MDFRKITLFVVPTGNTLPTTGTTSDLTAGQFGVFRQDWSVATAGNIAAASYIYLAQGRIEVIPGLGSKKSDKLMKGNGAFNNNIIELYKVTGSATVQEQITEVDDIEASCDEEVTVTVRLFSRWAETGFYNGLTRSVTVKTPCCDCGDSPCASVDRETIVDDFVAGINAEPMLSQFVIATKDDSDPTNPKLVITGLPLTEYGADRCDPTVFPYQYDRLFFRTYAYRGPANTQDYEVFDACDQFATVTITQESDYPKGTPSEIKQIEKRWFSYQTTHKSLFSNTNYNNAYVSYVEDNVTAYTTFYIRFYEVQNNSYQDAAPQESMVIIAAPATEAAAIQTRLELFFGSGAFVDKS